MCVSVPVAQVTDGNGVGYLYDSYGADHPGLDCKPAATGLTNAVKLGLQGGVDIEDGQTLNNYALAAVADGNITMADIDTALGRSLPFLFRLGLADPPAIVPYSKLGPSDVDTPAHRQLALEAAQQSIVLLRNDPVRGKPVLPLTFAKGMTVAVIGPNANRSSVLLANYHGGNTLVESHTPLLAVSRAAEVVGATVVFQPGCADAPCADSGGIAAAAQAAAGADVVLLFMGLAPSLGGPGPGVIEGEELDRTNITLPGLQEELISAVTSAGKTVVLVLIHGGAVALSPQSLALPTIVDSVYPGELGGDAIVDVLLGAVSPSGRLMTTVYPADFVNTRSIIDYNFTSAQGITYQYYTGTPDWPFGFGLSYTTWQFAWLGQAHVAACAVGQWSNPSYSVNVTNTGSVTSDVSVLAFLQPTSGPGPLKEVFDFQRAAAVAPGQTVTLLFTVPADVAARATGKSASSLALFPGDEFEVRIGHPGEFMLTGSLTLTAGVVQSQ